ncbi:hypothetical protein RISW2_02265 [Roseivivax isoporae LMG 25204]|uniref:Uncharacterized protein n=1 Tax=Roseivivax isoporae LMG 25204 TaxID=1449351 RepID=X7F8R4_9RHOB|nr:hypothetical protein RISW2_02265 [Roseivivax isoporae LMG 25204]
MCRDREDQHDEDRAQVPARAEDRQPRDAAAGQDHARPEHESARHDREHRQVRGHEAVAAEIDPAGCDRGLRADDRDGERGQPDATRGARVAADERAAQAEARAFREDPERETEDKAEDDGRLGHGQGLDPQLLEHGAHLPQDLESRPDRAGARRNSSAGQAPARGGQRTLVLRARAFRDMRSKRARSAPPAFGPAGRGRKPVFFRVPPPQRPRMRGSSASRRPSPR